VSISQKRRTSIRLQLVAPGTKPLWIDTDDFQSTAGVKRIRGRLVLRDRDRDFDVRPGNQTADNDVEIPQAPNLLSGSGTNNAAWLNNIDRYFVDMTRTSRATGSSARRTSTGTASGTAATFATAALSDASASDIDGSTVQNHGYPSFLRHCHDEQTIVSGGNVAVNQTTQEAEVESTIHKSVRTKLAASHGGSGSPYYLDDRVVSVTSIYHWGANNWTGGPQLRLFADEIGDHMDDG
jgi:hypothetical protein